MKERDLKLHKLSKNRYRELRYFCKQYYEWKDKLKKLNYDLKSYELDGLPKNSNVNKPTELLATEKADLERKIEIVEQAAKEASPVLYQDILKNVVQCIPFRHLNVPCSIKYFYKVRNTFFCILDKKKI